jgi:hypothetical protein
LFGLVVKLIDVVKAEIDTENDGPYLFDFFIFVIIKYGRVYMSHTSCGFFFEDIIFIADL